MREIKFRFWHKALNEYVEKRHHYSPTLSEGEISSDVHIIEQYTGLKDKNGVEIYEGDIIKVINQPKGSNVKEVKYNQQKACFYMTLDGFYLTFNVTFSDGDTFRCNQLEIIGNIHQNPELI